uniref:C2H2-type domain-containing protein n=1 Tax=Anopheles epiroticus TaxID=199890 RepID=A0A182PQ32_9DIPT
MICKECLTTLCAFRDYRERCLEHLFNNLSEDNVQDGSTEHDGSAQIAKLTTEEIVSSCSQSTAKDDPKPSPVGFTKTFQTIVTSANGKKRYIYDCKQTYQKQLVECDICHKSFAKTRLEGHRNVHLGLRPWNCERGCEQRFHCKQLLLHHYRNVHGGEPHCCDVCGKVLRSKRSLGYHIKDSHGEKKHPCSFCGQLFVSNARLNQHIKYHRDERNYPCDQCKCSFFSSNDLKKHSATHKKQRPEGHGKHAG